MERKKESRSINQYQHKLYCPQKETPRFPASQLPSAETTREPVRISPTCCRARFQTVKKTKKLKKYAH